MTANLSSDFTLTDYIYVIIIQKKFFEQTQFKAIPYEAYRHILHTITPTSYCVQIQIFNFATENGWEYR